MLAPMQRSRDLAWQLENRRVLVCAGAGGVGKTTVSAALALAAATRNKRVLCLTIDPARRLASSLGLSEFPSQQLEVPKDFLTQQGIPVNGSLTVMMLDPRATFDELIFRYAASEEEAARIVERKIYQHLAQNLSGTHSYMAMEKVLSVLRDESYDLIVLDTPPSARALDFFDAPKKMVDILDSPATRALIAAVRGGHKLQLSIVGVGLRAALRGLQGIAGNNFIFELADLLGSMNDLLGGFEQRAKDVAASLLSEQFGYLLITSPHPRTQRDAASLARALSERGLPLGAVVVNQMSPTARIVPSSNVELAQQFHPAASAEQSTDLADKVLALAVKQRQLRLVQEATCSNLFATLGPQVSRVLLPKQQSTALSAQGLFQLSQLLLAGEGLGVLGRAALDSQPSAS